jgi:hypothetical protein
MLDDIKKTLWATADKLRANMDAAEYKHLVLGLIFVEYISDTFAARRAELRPRLLDPADDYFYGQASAEDIDAELEDRDCYREVNVFWVPEPARWEALRAAAKQPDIGKRIDDALALIERKNPKLKGILDKRYARAQLPDGKLGELVDLVSTIGVRADPNRRSTRADDYSQAVSGSRCRANSMASCSTRPTTTKPGFKRQTRKWRGRRTIPKPGFTCSRLSRRCQDRTPAPSSGRARLPGPSGWRAKSRSAATIRLS